MPIHFAQKHREKRWVISIITLHLLAISLPYVWAWAIEPDGFTYGGLLYNPDDQNVHLAWARQASEGHFFFRDLFTTESLDERPLFTNLLCWMIGIIHAFTGAPLVLVYHALRLLFAALALLAFYGLSTRFTNEARIRIVALALAAFSSGVGFLAPLFPGIIWLDRPDNTGFPMMPEAFTFSSSFIFTLNIAAMALLIATYFFALRAADEENEKRRRDTALGFACAFLLSNIHTYDAIPLILTLLIGTVWNCIKSIPPRARWFPIAIIQLGAILPVLYQILVFRGSEEFRVKALTQTPAPALWHIVISYGLLIPLALAGGVLALRAVSNEREKSAARLLVLWPLVTLLCIYTPVSFARKMIEGLHLPLCLLAALGIIALISKLSSPLLRRAAAIGVVALCSVSSLQFMAWCLRDVQERSPARASLPPAYFPRGEWEAMRFLRDKAKNKAVLCLHYAGNYLPRESGQTVFVGHWAETLRFGDKFNLALRFYGAHPSRPPMSGEQAKQWLLQNRIGYIMIGFYEKQLSARLPLDLGLPIHDKNGTAIYAVPP